MKTKLTYSFIISIFLLSFFTPTIASIKNDSLSYKITSAPKWALKHKYNKNHKLKDTQPSQYLLVDRQSKLYGKPADYFRYVVKPLTNSGVDTDSELKIDFNPAFQTLNIHSIKIIRNNKVRDVTKKVKIRIIQQESQLSEDLLQGRASALIVLEDIRVNDIIDYQYTLEGRNPVFGKKVFGNLSLSWSAHVDKVDIRLVTAANRPLKIKMHNSSIKPKVRKNSRYIEYSIRKHHIKPIADEQDYPHDYLPFSWLQYSEYKSWKDVSQWGMSLYKVQKNPSKELRNLFKKLKAKSRTDEEFIINALDFVQNDIRYLGLEFGENSHKPHAPNEVLNKRFGDCKDKSVLLNSLLSYNNIKAYPALVSSSMRNAVRTHLPGPGSFDHVISYVRHNGKSYWLDGTRTYQTGTLNSRGTIDYGHALVIGYNRLSDMYKGFPSPSRIDVKEDIIIDDFESAVTLNIATTYRKSMAEYMRYKFDNQPLNKIQKDYTEFFNRYYPEIEPIKTISYNDNLKHNTFTVKESYRVNNYLKRKDNKFVSNIYVLSFKEKLKTPKVKDRKSPFYLGSLVDINHQTQIHYPEDIEMPLNEKPVILKNKSLEYRYTDSYANRKYTHKARLKILNDRIKAKDMDDYLALLEKIKEDWSYNLTFLDPTSITGYREILTLKKRLKELSK